MEADAEMAGYHGTTSAADEFSIMENEHEIDAEMEVLKASMSKKKEMEQQ
jgi:phage shock protein A